LARLVRRCDALGGRQGDSAGHSGRGDLIIAVGKRSAGGRAAPGQVEVLRLVEGGLLRFGRADGDHLVTAQPGYDGAGTQEHGDERVPGEVEIEEWKCLAELIDTAFDDFNESIVFII
jgi:hypothetical protein